MSITQSFSDQLGLPTQLQNFEATRKAALARAASISPSVYARTRNALDGAVSGLSPYLTHGIVRLPEVAALVAQKHRLSYEDKLVFEWGWREFFHHVWETSPRPDAILSNMRDMNLWRGKYAAELPADIRQGRTGVPCIDSAVRQLYATGYIHNHARMWIASYCVHFRKVHWRAGADWLYAHLLDGDVPSNHLSWQWVASSFSNKPYLFNAENVARYAPQKAFKAWISKGTVIDTTYETLDELCRSSADVGAEPGKHEGIKEPRILTHTDTDFLKHLEQLAGVEYTQSATEWIAIALQSRTADQAIELIHPWAMHGEKSEQSLRIGIIHTAAHAMLPWSEKRWHFVLTRMREACDCIWIGDIGKLGAIAGWPGKTKINSQSTLFEGYRDILPRMTNVQPLPKLFIQPQRSCNSFSKFYEQVQRGEREFSKLLCTPQQRSLL